jgi:hypothetical protein
MGGLKYVSAISRRFPYDYLGSTSNQSANTARQWTGIRITCGRSRRHLDGRVL